MNKIQIKINNNNINKINKTKQLNNKNKITIIPPINNHLKKLKSLKKSIPPNILIQVIIFNNKKMLLIQDYHKKQ
jgi:hypothetical protein